MVYNFIINPKTNRKVKVNSRLGQSIIKQYLQQSGGKRKRSVCVQYHDKPILCNVEKSCTYRRIRGKGQCYRSSAKDLKKTRERARKDKKDLFEKDAGLRLLRATRKNKFLKLVKQAQAAPKPAPKKSQKQCKLPKVQRRFCKASGLNDELRKKCDDCGWNQSSN